MPIIAYVLINVDPGKDREVAEAVSKIKGVKEARPVAGPYDVVAVVEASDTKALGEITINKIRPVGGVTQTLTLIAY